MKGFRFSLLLVLMVVLIIPRPGWPAPEPTADGQEAPAGEVCATGPGQGFEPCPPGDECPNTFGPIIADSAAVMEKGKFSLQPTWEYSFVTSSFSPSWRRVSAGGDHTGFSQYLKLTYGLWDNLEVFAEMNTYTHNWSRNVNEPGPRGETSADFGGIGNTLLVLKYQFTQETPTLPIITGYFGTLFPTGHYRNFNPSRLGTDQIGEGGYQFLVGLNLQKYLEPFVLYGNFWYRTGTSYKTDGEDAFGNPRQVLVTPRNGVIVNLAVEYPITKKWVALLEMISSWDTGLQLATARSNQARGSFLALSPGIEYMATDKFSLALGVYVDVVGRNTEASVAPILSMVYAF